MLEAREECGMRERPLPRKPLTAFSTLCLFIARRPRAMSGEEKISGEENGEGAGGRKEWMKG